MTDGFPINFLRLSHFAGELAGDEIWPLRSSSDHCADGGTYFAITACGSTAVFSTVTTRPDVAPITIHRQSFRSQFTFFFISINCCSRF